ncbi:MAG: hypothetical protein E4G90_02825 [Gemmatimonadales bacterium]|nr:MAG: hypothetical protein E4G90_02825 [Gemmatimonadales bacterium]
MILVADQQLDVRELVGDVRRILDEVDMLEGGGAEGLLAQVEDRRSDVGERHGARYVRILV